ncbi:MAG: hypothetical protein Q9174_007478, partial [Haloplaca sp. 1 TL-2023]
AEEDLHYNDFQLLMILADIYWYMTRGSEIEDITTTRDFLNDRVTQRSSAYKAYIEVWQLNKSRSDKWTRYFKDVLKDAEKLNKAIARIEQKDLAALLILSRFYLTDEDTMMVFAAKKWGLTDYEKFRWEDTWKSVAPRAFKGREDQLPVRVCWLARHLWPDFYNRIAETRSEEMQEWIEFAQDVLGRPT